MLFIQEVPGNVDDIVAKIKKTAKDNEFDVLDIRDLKQKMAAKGVDLACGCRLIEVCNPRIVKEVLENTRAISTARPCRISVRRKDLRVKSLFISCLFFSMALVGSCQMPTEQQASEPEYFTVYPIGHVEKRGGRTFIVLDREYEAGLKGLEKHSYVHVVYWFDRNDTPEKRAILQVHPRGDPNNPVTGVFATHSPLRPNLIAISKCDIISIEGNVVEIRQIDAFDGSPVLDLKGDFFKFCEPKTK
jgi:tRNA-Thr(GGU) m(6)t(6)A37 methyltransferase TsaA